MIIPAYGSFPFVGLSTLLRKLDSQDQVIVPKPVHLLGSSNGVITISVTDESKALCSTSLAVFRQEDSCDTTCTAEQLAELVLFCVLGYLENGQ